MISKPEPSSDPSRPPVRPAHRNGHSAPAGPEDARDLNAKASTRRGSLAVLIGVVLVVLGSCAPSVRPDLGASTPADAIELPLDDGGTAHAVTVRGSWTAADESIRRALTECLIAPTALRATAAARRSAQIPGPLGVRSVIDEREVFAPPPDPTFTPAASPDDTLHYVVRTLRGDEGWLRVERVGRVINGPDELRIIVRIGVFGSTSRESCVLATITTLLENDASDQ